MKCALCNNKLTGQKKKFCSVKCKNKVLQSYDRQVSRGIARKLKLIAEYGSKCSKCGYNKNMAALAFHHTNPSDKVFKMDIKTISNRSWKKCLAESKKCILVCHNCHMELHYPQFDLGILLEPGAGFAPA